MRIASTLGASVALLLCANSATAENPPNLASQVDPSLADYAKPQRLVSLRDGRRIHLFCLGHGAPTVILTAGLGDWVATWRKLQAPIAKKTRACAWDRAGFGYSDPSPVPQGVNHTTADLEEALINADIPGPYILIGHSMGGYESMIFADRDHRAVLGMLLIDPSFPDEIRRANLVAPLFGAFLSKSIDERAVMAKKCAAVFASTAIGNGTRNSKPCLEYPATLPLELKKAMGRLDRNPRRWTTQASAFENFPTSSRVVINPKFTELLLTSHDLPRPTSYSADVGHLASIVIWSAAHAIGKHMKARGKIAPTAIESEHADGTGLDCGGLDRRRRSVLIGSAAAAIGMALPRGHGPGKHLPRFEPITKDTTP